VGDLAYHRGVDYRLHFYKVQTSGRSQWLVDVEKKEVISGQRAEDGGQMTAQTSRFSAGSD